MDGSQASMSGTACFCNGHTFCCRTDLTDADHVGMLTEDSLQKEILVDIKLRVFIGPGEQMADTVEDVAIFIPFHEIELTAAVFDGDEAAIIRNC